MDTADVGLMFLKWCQSFMISFRSAKCYKCKWKLLFWHQFILDMRLKFGSHHNHHCLQKGFSCEPGILRTGQKERMHFQWLLYYKRLSSFNLPRISFVGIKYREHSTIWILTETEADYWTREKRSWVCSEDREPSLNTRENQTRPPGGSGCSWPPEGISQRHCQPQLSYNLLWQGINTHKAQRIMCVCGHISVSHCMYVCV